VEVKEVVEVLWRRRFIIITTFILTLSGAYYMVSQLEDEFYLGAILRATTPTRGDIRDINYADRLTNTYRFMVNTVDVEEELKERAGLREIPEINVEGIANTELLHVQVETQNIEIVHILVDILIEQSNEWYFGDISPSLEDLDQEIDIATNDLYSLIDEFGLTGQIIIIPSNSVVPVIDESSREHLSPINAIRFESAENRLRNLVNDRWSLQRSELLQNTNLSIVEIDESSTAKSPPRLLMLAFSGLLGIGAGVGLAFVGENIDTRLYTIEQIEKLVDIFTIGHIPKDKTLSYQRHRLQSEKEQPRWISKGNRFQVLEAFRYIRMNILIKLDKQQTRRIIAVVSAAPREGKSTIVANLASILAAAEYKVLLIDGDLRTPKQHQIFQIPNQIGLSNILTEQRRFSEAIQLDEVTNVYVMPSGTNTHEAVDLLGGTRIHRMLSALDSTFDLVLIDTPALTSVSDGITLLSVASHSILVVARRQAHYHVLNSVLQQLNFAGIDLVGLIINYSNSLLKNSRL
jgi:capsular exopolysaccharide synthesis family protein